jgi:glucokinase
MNDNLVFAADLGGTNMRVALVDQSGKIHHRLKQPTPHGESPQVVIDALTSALAQCDSASRGQTVAASIMVPGTVDRANERVVQAPNLPSLNDFRLKQELEKQFNFPVVLENDANAAAVGEHWMGAARGVGTVVCVTLGTGVGGGIILEGKLWRGAHGSAGEIGHTTVEPFGGLECKCGNTGCLELFASATGLVRMTREDLAVSSSSILKVEELTAAQVYDAGVAGDDVALRVFAKLGDYLGVGLANLIDLIDPDLIVIGGGVANGWKLFEVQMHEQVNARTFKATPPLVKIVPAECGDDAGLLGAARLGFDEVLSHG